MNMNEIKPAATQYFNTQISDTFAQNVFTDAFDLWGDEPSLYDASSNAYKAVINSFIPAIKMELQQSAALSEQYTSILNAVNDATRHEAVDVTKNTTATNTAHSDVSSDENTQKQIQYPDGYIAPPDTAYLRSEIINAPTNEATDSTSTDTNTDTTIQTTDGTDNATSENKTTDNIARANAINNYTPHLTALIEQCVFAFVGGKYRGCL